MLNPCKVQSKAMPLRSRRDLMAPWLRGLGEISACSGVTGHPFSLAPKKLQRTVAEACALSAGVFEGLQTCP